MSSADPPHYMQIGVLFGGVGECGNKDFPNIYARLEDKDILNWVKVVGGVPDADTQIPEGVFSTTPVSSEYTNLIPTFPSIFFGFTFAEL